VAAGGRIAMKILIAEDQPDHRRLLVLAVRPLVFGDDDIIEAETGAEAIELAQCHQPDIILMDVAMPEMDGFEALEKLKADGATVLIPVMLISALSRENDIERGLKLGAVDYMKKPFDIGKLREKIKVYAKKKVRDGPGLTYNKNPNLHHNRKELKDVA